MNRLKAQSTLEYLLVMSAIVGIIIYAAANWIKPGVQKALDNSWTVMGNASDKLDTP
jgi:hypothetical protein